MKTKSPLETTCAPSPLPQESGEGEGSSGMIYPDFKRLKEVIDELIRVWQPSTIPSDLLSLEDLDVCPLFTSTIQSFRATDFFGF